MMSTQLALKSDFLSKHKLFGELEYNEIERFAHTTTVASYQRGHHFYRAGEMGKVLFILKEGLVYLYRLTPLGRKLVVTILTPGAIFGDLSLMGQKIYRTFAMAVRPSDVYVISHLELRHLICRRPKLVLKLMETVSEHIMEIERQLSQNILLKVPSRLALLLLDLNARNIDLGNITHQELADMLGVYRETVSFAMMDFRALGFIDTSRTKCQIIDRQGLETFVQKNR